MPWAPQKRNAKPKQRQSLTRQRCKLYASTAWRNASLQFRRENPICKSCEARGIVRPSQCTDHSIPHKGDPVIFWDRSLWVAMCNTCHNSKSGREAHG